MTRRDTYFRHPVARIANSEAEQRPEYISMFMNFRCRVPVVKDSGASSWQYLNKQGVRMSRGAGVARRTGKICRCFSFLKPDRPSDNSLGCIFSLVPIFVPDAQ